MDWKLADAKNRLSEVVTLANTEGPQTIRRHDAVVIVVAEAKYRELTGERPTFNDWLLNGPSIDGGLELPPRSHAPMRSVDL